MDFTLFRTDINKIRPRGRIGAIKIPAYKKADLSWKIKNWLGTAYLKGLLSVASAQAFSKLTGHPVLVSELSAIKIDSLGHKTDYGIVSRRVVTNNGVQWITDSWRGSQTLGNMKYHGCGTGSTAENVADSALVTESTTALNPDNTRATGSLAGATNTFQTVGTATFDASAAIVEHGLFSQSATGGGVLFDRSVFSAINVVSGDSIQFTYTLTLTAGG